MCRSRHSTYRHAWSLRRQVLHEPPAKGDLTISLAAIGIGCNGTRVQGLRGEYVSVKVPWTEPLEKRSSGQANAAYQNCSPGGGSRDVLDQLATGPGGGLSNPARGQSVIAPTPYTIYTSGDFPGPVLGQHGAFKRSTLRMGATASGPRYG